jgi:hypothetical protein
MKKKTHLKMKIKVTQELSMEQQELLSFCVHQNRDFLNTSPFDKCVFRAGFSLPSLTPQSPFDDVVRNGICFHYFPSNLHAPKRRFELQAPFMDDKAYILCCGFPEGA